VEKENGFSGEIGERGSVGEERLYSCDGQNWGEQLTEGGSPVKVSVKERRKPK